MNGKTSVRMPVYRILCRINCEETETGGDSYRDRDRIHPANIFEDVPRWNWKLSETNLHLTGYHPVHNVSHYLRSLEAENIGFMIFRGYSCSNALNHTIKAKTVKGYHRLRGLWKAMRIISLKAWKLFQNPCKTPCEEFSSAA